MTTQTQSKSNIFEQLLPVDPQTSNDARSSLKRMKTVGEFFTELITSTKDTGIMKAIADLSPWAEAATGALSEAAPPIKFILTFVDKLTRETDPIVLGYLACTLAYQQAFTQSISLEPEIQKKMDSFQELDTKRVIEDLDRFTNPKELQLQIFSFDRATVHPFTREADSLIVSFCKAVGLDDADKSKLLQQIHLRFISNLKLILCHGDTKDKFDIFTRLLALGTDQRADWALKEHADYQRWLFEERPLFGQEPFSLAYIYVDADCGEVTWDEFMTRKFDRAPSRKDLCNDPFDEKFGGRKPLLQTVMGLITDPTFDDAIVIQGVAGAGKSTFTLRLCTELIDRGFRPIRIELRDLEVSPTINVAEALPEAVCLTERDRSGPGIKPRFGSGLFKGGAIFEENIDIAGTVLCPYVLILDGWDEISLSASDNFQQQVTKVLKDIFDRFLNRRRQSVPVRVILTGRPTEAVGESGILRKTSRLLTLRSLTPGQLRTLRDKLLLALNTKPLISKSEPQWDIEKICSLDPLFSRYEESLKKQEYELFKEDGGIEELLSMPLLAYLTFWLMGRWPGNPEDFMGEPTLLYKSIVDLVVDKGGKILSTDYDVTDKPHITGTELRDLLRQTAQAMTAIHSENISRRELLVRLDIKGRNTEKQIDNYQKEYLLSRLMISFFFKGGKEEFGCEFSHKSFREYLFAERIVEVLKKFGIDSRLLGEEKPAEEYWKDFEKGDLRYDATRELAELLGPQWISYEVDRHLRYLINWEIDRAFEKDLSPKVGTPTERISDKQWEKIRDMLADIWDWWGEGVHLRPQPYYEEGTYDLKFRDPLSVIICQKNRMRSETGESWMLPPIPPTTTIDAHLGDGLIRLTAAVHAAIAENRGWEGFVKLGNRLNNKFEEKKRRYQSIIVSNNTNVVLFGPGGTRFNNFRNFCARINADGCRYMADNSGRYGEFPTGISLRFCVFDNSGLCEINFSQADLSGTTFWGSNLIRSNYCYANLTQSDFFNADLSFARFDHAFLYGVDMSRSTLIGAQFTRAILMRANLFKSGALKADFSIATLSYANLKCAVLVESNLSFSKLADANLYYTDLSGADVNGAEFYNSKVDRKQLEECENLDKAINLDKIVKPQDE